MNGLRQAYTHSMAFVTLLALAAGAQGILAVWVASLMGRIADPPQAWRVMAAGIALVAVAGPAWLLHYLWAKRMAGRLRVDRFSIPRLLYLSAAMFVSLAGIAVSAVAVLSHALALRFWDTPPWAVAGFLVWGVGWLVHRRVEEEAEAQEPAARYNRATAAYLYATSALGLGAAVTGASLALGRVLYALGGCPTPVPSGPARGLCAPLQEASPTLALGAALAVVGLAVWLSHWARAQRDEPSSWLRVTYLYVVTLLLGGVVTLGALAGIVGLVVQGLADSPVSGVDRPLPLAAALVPALAIGGAVWAFHQRRIHQDARLGAWRIQHAMPAMRYLTAGVAVTALSIGLWGGLAFLASRLAPWDGGVGLLGWRLWAGPVAILTVLGGVPWAYLVARSHPRGREHFREELRLVSRRAYLYAALAGGVGALVVGLAWLLAGLLGDVGDRSLSQGSLGRLAPQAAAAVVGALAVALHGAWLQRDLRSSGDRRPMGRLVVLVVPEGDMQVARRVEQAVGAQVRVLHTWSRVGPGVAMTDEQLDRIVRAVREGESDKYLVLLVGQWPEVHALR